MLRMRADRQHHVVAGGQLLFLDVVGGRHLREPQIGVLVDQTDLRNRVRAERQNRGLAGSDVLRSLLVGDGRILLRVVLVNFNQLAADGRPQVGEGLAAVLEIRVFRFRHQRRIQRCKRRLQRPRIGGARLNRRDALGLEPLEQRDEFAPRLRRIVRILAGLLPHIGVDDVAACVARVRNTVQTLLGLVGGLHEALRDVHHARIELVDDLVVGEIVEDARFGEHAVIDVAVDGDDVGFAVLHQSRAQIGGGVRRIVDIDFDVGMGFLEFTRLGGEPIRRLGLELEEIQGDRAGGAVAAAREPNRQHNRACSRNSTARDPPEGACVGIGIRFHSLDSFVFSFFTAGRLHYQPPLLFNCRIGLFSFPVSARPHRTEIKNGYFVILGKKIDGKDGTIWRFPRFHTGLKARSTRIRLRPAL